MKIFYVIGGMGAGKSTVVLTLKSLGLPTIDLDKLSHSILNVKEIKEDLVCSFGSEILDRHNHIDHHALAQVAFASPKKTHMLNSLVHPYVKKVFYDKLKLLEKSGNKICVVEYPVFENRNSSFAGESDVIIAVVSSIKKRMQRLFEAGWTENDIKRRIAAQISDTERIKEADVVFYNDGTKQDLQKEVCSWWKSYQDIQKS